MYRRQLEDDIYSFSIKHVHRLPLSLAFLWNLKYIRYIENKIFNFTQDKTPKSQEINK